MTTWVEHVEDREVYTPRLVRREPLTDFFTGAAFGAAVVVLFWTLFGR